MDEDKVYAVLDEWYDTKVGGGQAVTIFRTLEDAKKFLNERVDIVKQDWDYDVEDRDDTSFQYYMDGEYDLHHATITILEKEIL